MQVTNYSSHIATQLMDEIFGVIHTRTLLENLLSFIVTHSNDLLKSPDTPEARIIGVIAEQTKVLLFVKPSRGAIYNTVM